MRVAINLLTEEPANPSGAHWFWTRVIPEMAKRLETGEELSLVVSPASKKMHQGYGDRVSYITYPWSNERRKLRTLSEHLYSPVRLPLGRVDVFSTLMAPILSPSWSNVVHIKTMHAFTAPASVAPLTRAYRLMSYPRTVKVAEAIIINSESLRTEIERHLEVDSSKLKLIPEAVDHDLFKPGDAAAARARVASYGVTKPFVLFV
jgi:glycosyltransferase involved in cell wall biosynthesis